MKTKIKNNFMKMKRIVGKINGFMSVSIALLIWYGMGKIHNGELSIGVLYAFTTYIKQFFEPIGDLSEDYGTIQSALVSADRIFEIVDQKENVEDLDAGDILKDFTAVWSLSMYGLHIREKNGYLKIFLSKSMMVICAHL